MAVSWRPDTTTDFGRRVERRLRDEYLVWLTTVRADGLPQPSPVWFLWDGETVLIYSQPGKPCKHRAQPEGVAAL